MKIKFYFLLLALFAAVQGFTAITVTITGPVQNQLLVGKGIGVFIKGTFKTSYDVQSLKAKLQGNEISLNYNKSEFGGVMSLNGLPQDTLTLIVTLTDVLNHTGSDTVKFIYDNPPVIYYPDSMLYITKPSAHILAKCLSDSGSCTVTLLNATGSKVIATSLNALDTLLDISGMASPGNNNNFIVSVKDRRGVTASGTFKYAFEPSPYLEHYADTLPKLIQVRRFEGGLFSVTTQDTQFNIHPAGISLPYPIPLQYVVSYNNNYLVWQNQNLFVNRYNITTHQHDSTLFSKVVWAIRVDTAGNFAISARISTPDPHPDDSIYVFNGAGFTPVALIKTGTTPDLRECFNIYGNRVAYLENKDSLYLFDGVKVIPGLAKAITGRHGSENFLIQLNDKYIAFYNSGNLSQSVIYLADSAFNITRITFSAGDATIFDITEDGNVIYGTQHANDFHGRASYSTFFGDAFGNNTKVASMGQYYRIGTDRLILNDGGLFKINLDIGSDSLIGIHKEAKKNTVYSFNASDFDNAFKGPGYLFKIQITALPKHGTLLLNGKPIEVDSIISHAAIKGLSYKPNTDYSGKDTLRWNAFNGYTFTSNDTIFELSIVTTLPVTLTNLTAKNNFKTNLVSWQTTQEVNSAYFDVQKSTDNNTFNTIGTVTAKGNSSITSSYAFTDVQPATGNNYYRLKIIDKDGQYSYSKTVLVKNNGGTGISMYPNPAKTSVQVSFANMQAGKYSVTVYTTSGKIVAAKTYTLGTGGQTVSLPVSQYAKGIYIIKITDSKGQVISTEKVVKE